MNKSVNYIPKNKHDFDSLFKLKELSRSEVVPLLPNLMEWIQDMNWPIATEVENMLLKYPDEIVPLIKNVLATNDNVWKYWCLEILVKRLPEQSIMLLKCELVSLIQSPTDGEKLEELDKIADEILHLLSFGAPSYFTSPNEHAEYEQHLFQLCSLSSKIY